MIEYSFIYICTEEKVEMTQKDMFVLNSQELKRLHVYDKVWRDKKYYIKAILFQ